MRTHQPQKSERGSRHQVAEQCRVSRSPCHFPQSYPHYIPINAFKFPINIYIYLLIITNIDIIYIYILDFYEKISNYPLIIPYVHGHTTFCLVIGPRIPTSGPRSGLHLAQLGDLSEGREFKERRDETWRFQQVEGWHFWGFIGF